MELMNPKFLVESASGQSMKGAPNAWLKLALRRVFELVGLPMTSEG